MIKAKILKKLEIISELAPIKEKIKLFEKKYKCNFKEFEKRMFKLNEENYEMWDDYIEWKAYIHRYNELNKRLKRFY
jgi:hypothetical protein